MYMPTIKLRNLLILTWKENPRTVCSTFSSRARKNQQEEINTIGKKNQLILMMIINLLIESKYSVLTFY